MQKCFTSVAVFTLITLVIWIYWSSNSDVKKTILILKQNDNFINRFIIKPNNSCSQVFLIIIVTSYVGHVELRSAHRRAMSSNILQSINATRVFLLANIPQNEKYITQKAINDESDTFGDILQGSFLENYRNLTYKHIMGLQWASESCGRASFILKVDDDTVFSLKRTYKLLLKLNNVDMENYLMGYMLNNTKPRRNKQNKWYVTWEEYSRSHYPPYLSGWYYITTPATAAKLSEEAVYHPYFWIDDIFVTGILTETIGIKLKQLPKDIWLEYYELLECCLRDMVIKSIRCDYIVGPNGGRNNLIVEYNEALRNCDNWKNCTPRTLDQSLNNNCVAFRERTIFSDGKAEIWNIKV